MTRLEIAKGLLRTLENCAFKMMFQTSKQFKLKFIE